MFLRDCLIAKRRFTKPWFRETDFFLKNTKLAFGRNHGFAKPWFRPWFPKFLKFPVPLIFCRNFPEFSHFRHLKGWERGGGGGIRIQKGARLLVVNMSDLKGCGQYKGMRNVRTG